MLRNHCLQQHEVIAIDTNEDAVDRVAQYVTRAAVGDAKNLHTLEKIGEGADAAVISTGDDITASILTTMAVHDLGIRDVYVKVISRDHAGDGLHEGHGNNFPGTRIGS